MPLPVSFRLPGLLKALVTLFIRFMMVPAPLPLQLHSPVSMERVAGREANRLKELRVRFSGVILTTVTTGKIWWCRG